jgi:tetratricopeptide (TPR) repeat protein
MASLIEGYNCDIFISYRQKDNKHDRWVTEFVNHLKGELESTFKEDISVYIDINPHDGLLETHDVDASLEEKLKCLIFIPIISRTYCDPKSFAWEHEFKSFVELASHDQFGLRVRLRNGNVAGRVLPILIHDLDNTDIRLCESVLGSALRGVEFIYKSAGVNRPLRSKEEKPHDNLNNTQFRDQINKVANSIDELIQGITQKASQTSNDDIRPHETKERREVNGEPDQKFKGNRKKIIAATSLVILLIVALLAFPKILNRHDLKNPGSSDDRIIVTVMPIQNMTNDTTWNIWREGIQNEIINRLTNSKELRVRQSESIKSVLRSSGLYEDASFPPSIAKNISQKLNSDVFIIGSIKQVESIIRLNAQVIDSKTEEAFKSFQIDGPEERILNIIDSLSLMINNFLIINLLEKEVPKDFHDLVSTNSAEAYRYYMYGNQAFYKYDFTTANEWFLKAIDIDSSFTEAIRMIVFTLHQQGLERLAKKWCLKNYSRRNQMPELEKIWTNIQYSILFEPPDERIKNFKLLIAYNDEMPVPHSNLGDIYNNVERYEQAIAEFEREFEIYKNWGSKPRWVTSYENLGFAYHKTNQYKKEKEIYEKAEIDFPDDYRIIKRQAILALSEGDTTEANEYINKYIFVRKAGLVSEADITTGLASIYSESGMPDKAERYFQEAFLLEPENPEIINNLAYFLIDSNRNISKGLELINKCLRLDPENFKYLHTRGWGLFKLGKFIESKDILHKSWDLRMQNSVYDHTPWLQLEEVNKAYNRL